MSRHKIPSLAILALAILANSTFAEPDAKKKTSDFETFTGAHSSIELSKTGYSFFRTFFRRGWPTTKEMKALTLNDCEGTSRDTLLALMTSGMGIRLADSTYIEELKRSGLRKGGKSWIRGTDVVTDKLLEFGQIAGLEKTPQFVPIVLEYSRGKPVYAKAYDAAKLSSHTWKSTGFDKTKLSFDSIGMTLYAQSVFARQQLLEFEHPVSKSKFNFGRNPKDAFFGLVCLHISLAKLHELRSRCIVYNRKLGIYKGIKKYSLSGTKAWIPHRIKVAGSGASLNFSIDTSKDAYQSHLLDQATILLACSELLKITRHGTKSATPKTKAERRLATIFKSQRFGTFEDVAIPPLSFQLVSDVALFVVTNMQRLHFDLDRRTFRSRSSENPELERIQALNSVDLGLSLSALASFLKESSIVLEQLKGKDVALRIRYLKVRRLAKTCTKLLGRWIRSVSSTKGFYSRYNITNKQPLDKNLSAAAAGAVTRGLLDIRLIPEADVSPSDKEASMSTALTLMKTAEKQLWNPSYKLYVGRKLKTAPTKKAPLAVDTVGQVAMIGALREIANLKKDVRYVLRINEIMSSLKSHGFIAAETIRGGDRGGDSDGDNVKTPDEAKVAPIVRPKLHVH